MGRSRICRSTVSGMAIALVGSALLAVGPAVAGTSPGVPTGVTAVRGDASAVISWLAPASVGSSPITGYTAYTGGLDVSHFTEEFSAPGPSGSSRGVALSQDGSELWVLAGSTVRKVRTDTGEAGSAVNIDRTNAGGSACLALANNDCLTLSPDGTRLYVAVGTGLAVVDTVNGDLETTVALGSPSNVAVTPDGTKLYVGLGGSLVVLDAATFAQIATIPVTADMGIAASPDGTEIYVVDATGGVVNVISTAIDEVVRTIAMPRGWLVDVAFLPNGSKAYVTSYIDRVYVVDTATGTVSTLIVAGAWAVSSSSRAVVVSGAVIDPATDEVVAQPLGSGGRDAVVADPSGLSAYLVGGSVHELSLVESSCSTPEIDPVPLSCEVDGLTNGTAYSFGVVARGAFGASAPSLPSNQVTPATSPEQVSGLTESDRTSSFSTVSWSVPKSWGLRITGYRLRTSSDGGESWSRPRDIDGVRAVVAIPYASARLVQVAGVNSLGQGDWSDSLLVTSKGTDARRLEVLSAEGEPISGGSITWEMVPRTSWSTVKYGLTADGVIDFPAAPAGKVKVSLNGGELPDGTFVSGEWITTLGFDSTVLQAPAGAKMFVEHRIRVTLPGGLPASGVAVFVSGVSSSFSSGGFTFARPASADSGVTDGSGLFTATGFASGDSSVRVTYEDGVIGQTQTVPVAGALTNVELDYAPYIQTVTSTDTASADEAVMVTLSASSASSLSARGIRSAGHPQAGVRVTLVPPRGAAANVKGKCAAQLTGVTNARGQIALRVCATKSGVFTVKAKGAVPVGAFTLLVNGKPSLQPRSLTATSPKLGQVRLSWAKPFFTGGATVTAYKATFTAKGKPTVVKELKVTAKSKLLLTVDGLSHATRYAVAVQAVTRYGVSDPVVATASVA
jgi:YVTN family beta-propeller protein